MGSRQDYLRQDSETVFMYNPQDSSECILYQFNLQIGDTICQHIFTGEHVETIFNRQLRVYSFIDFPVVGFGDNVADSLGAILYYGDLGVYDQLSGAVINGVIYGTIDEVSENKSVQPNDFVLSQNYPNPFNPSTSIAFSVTRTDWINLTVLNLLGQNIAVLVNEEKHPGKYVIAWKPEAISSGVYFYRLRSGLYTSTRQMIYSK